MNFLQAPSGAVIDDQIKHHDNKAFTKDEAEL